MKAPKGIRILSICDDEGIRFSRELVLRQEGYAVESLASTEPLDPNRARSCQLAILCHSLSPDCAARITAFLRELNPLILVVRVHAIRSTLDPYYDADCEVLPGPGQLLQGIQLLCARLEQPAESAAQRKRA